jgi:hypothetical protein
MSGDHQVLLSAEPLAKLVRDAIGYTPEGIACLASDAGVSTRAIQRILAGHRIRVTTADRVTIALGYHPAMVWGVDWCP